MDPKVLKESLIGQFWPYKAWWYQISQNENFGLLFQKWSLGTQESFCKVSDQLDTQLNNYGLISWHTASINCVNNCTFIFTRHQPRLFLKALLVYVMFNSDMFSKSTIHKHMFLILDSVTTRTQSSVTGCEWSSPSPCFHTKTMGWQDKSANVNSKWIPDMARINRMLH